MSVHDDVQSFLMLTRSPVVATSTRTCRKYDDVRVYRNIRIRTCPHIRAFGELSDSVGTRVSRTENDLVATLSPATPKNPTDITRTNNRDPHVNTSKNYSVIT